MSNFMAECDELARLVETGFINAVLPSLLIVMLAFAALQPKRINSATRVWAWSFVLALLVFLPVEMLVRKPSSFDKTEQTRSVQRKIPITTGGVWFVNSIPVSPIPAQKALSFSHWKSAVAAIALLIVAVRMLRLFSGLIRALSLKSQATRMPSCNLGSRITHLLHPDHGGRTVSVAVSRDITVPVVVGYRQPAILVPAYLMETLSSADIEQVLLHELAHVERYDDWALLMQRTVESIFAFHPLVQFVGLQIDLHREIACDDRALSSLQPKAYATCLAKIAELTGTRSAMGLSASFVEHKGQLSRRLESMLDHTREHMPALSARYLTSFASAAALLAFVSLKTPALVANPVPVTEITPLQAFARRLSMVAEPQSAAGSKAVPTGSVATSAASTQDDSHNDSIESLTITSGDAKHVFFQNYGDDYQQSFNFPKNAILYRKNGVKWVIRDPKVLSEAQAIMRPQEDLGKQQAALGEQQAKLGETQASLGAQQAAFSDRKLEPAQMQALQQQLRELEQKVRSLATDGSERTTSETQGQLASLQAQLGEMQSRVGQEQSKTAGEQAKLGAAQAQLGAQQAHLGAQQSRLGSAQAQAAKVAQGKLRELIQHAEAQHLSEPLQ